MILRKWILLALFHIVLTEQAHAEDLPGQSLAPSGVQLDIVENIWIFELVADNNCQDRKVIDTEVIEEPKDVLEELEFGRSVIVAKRWIERWTVDRCGSRVQYTVVFAPDGIGGAFFCIQEGFSRDDYCKVSRAMGVR